MFSMVLGKVVCILEKCFFVMEKRQRHFYEKKLPDTENIELEYANFGGLFFQTCHLKTLSTPTIHDYIFWYRSIPRVQPGFERNFSRWCKDRCRTFL